MPEWHAKGNAALGVMETHLKTHDWFAGQRYSVADIALYGYTHAADEGGFDLARLPGRSALAWTACRASRDTFRLPGAGKPVILPKFGRRFISAPLRPREPEKFHARHANVRCPERSPKPGVMTTLSLKNDATLTTFGTWCPPRTKCFQEKAVMTTGQVKFFNATKGFGFIAPEDGGKDVFVHVTAVQAAGLRGLNEGQRVSFDIEADKRGPKAVNLKIV